MKKFVSLYGLQARDTSWPYRVRSDHEFEFEPGITLILIGEPSMYYRYPRKQVRFRLEGGSRDYFADLRHFNEYTRPR